MEQVFGKTLVVTGRRSGCMMQTSIGGIIVECLWRTCLSSERRVIHFRGLACTQPSYSCSSRHDSCRLSSCGIPGYPQSSSRGRIGWSRPLRFGRPLRMRYCKICIQRRSNSESAYRIENRTCRYISLNATTNYSTSADI